MVCSVLVYRGRARERERERGDMYMLCHCTTPISRRRRTPLVVLVVFAEARDEELCVFARVVLHGLVSEVHK